MLFLMKKELTVGCQEEAHCSRKDVGLRAQPQLPEVEEHRLDRAHKVH